jgi:hypothetical protein
MWVPLLFAVSVGVGVLVLATNFLNSSGTSGTPEASDRENASTLESTLSLGFMDSSGPGIESVEVVGTSATVYVDGDLTEAEADYVCDYTLDAAAELSEQGTWDSEDGLGGQLLEVSVRNSNGLFDRTSCSW